MFLGLEVNLFLVDYSTYVQQLSLKSFADKVQLSRKNIAGVYRKKNGWAAPEE